MYYNIVVQKALSRNQIENTKTIRKVAPLWGLEPNGQTKAHPIRGKTAPAKNPHMGI
jgi:hypothetical protein